MSVPCASLPHAPDRVVSYYWSGDTLRSRSVGGVVLSGRLDIPAPPPRLLADWQRDAALRLALEPGDVEVLSLPRARMRWPDYRRCVDALADWTRLWGLQEVLAVSDVALMACRGAAYHHDADLYGGAAFCNLFLSEDQGLDLHFPMAGQRIPLVRGTAVVFDTAQPHAVIGRQSAGFDAADFGSVQDCTQIFLTWELSMEQVPLSDVLGVTFDGDAATASQLEAAQIRRDGVQVSLCPDSGGWC